MNVDTFNNRWGRVSLAAVADKRLTDRALRVLAALAAFADREGRCNPSHARLATILSVTRQAVGPHVKTLARLGYITVERRVRRRGGWAANAYIINFNPAAIAIEAEPALGEVIDFNKLRAIWRAAA